MNNKVRSALVLVATLSFAVEAQAETFTLIGATDCGKWISQRTEPQKAWLLGFLSGINLMWSADKSNSPTNPLDSLSSGEQAWVWMDNYSGWGIPACAVVSGKRLTDSDSKRVNA